MVNEMLNAIGWLILGAASAIIIPLIIGVIVTFVSNADSAEEAAENGKIGFIVGFFAYIIAVAIILIAL